MGAQCIESQLEEMVGLRQFGVLQSTRCAAVSVTDAAQVDDIATH